jgi:hypothetical protein
MRKALLLLVVALAGPAWAAAPISKTEIRGLPDREAKRRVMAQLSDLLVADGYGSSKGHRPKVPLSDLWFRTRAHGTATAGVCVSSTVVIRFRAVADGPRSADTPVAASDIESTAYYRLLRPVDPDDMDRLDAADQVQADSDCAAIDVRNADMIVAPDEDTLVTSLWLLRKAKAAQRSRQPAALDCEGFKQSCDALLAALDPAKIQSVDKCPNAGNVRCFTMEDGDVSAELRVDPNDRVTSIKFGQEIIIADLRQD